MRLPALMYHFIFGCDGKPLGMPQAINPLSALNLLCLTGMLHSLITMRVLSALACHLSIWILSCLGECAFRIGGARY